MSDAQSSVQMLMHRHLATCQRGAPAHPFQLYPKLAIRLISQFSIELVRSVLAGELNLALVTAPPEDSQIEAAPFVLTPLYAALPEGHAAAQKEHLALQDLAKDEWILFARRVHPVLPPQIRLPASSTNAN